MANTTMSVGSLPVATPDPPQKIPGTLREATQEFEALFVAEVFKEMRHSVPESDLLGTGNGHRLFRDMLDEELARQAAGAGGFGLGEILYRQLCPTVPTEGSQHDENRP